MAPNLRSATPDDVAALGAVLGRAFADDPIWCWIYPQPDRGRRLRRMFRTLLAVSLARGATVLTDEAGLGVAIWQQSDDRDLGLAGNVRVGAAMVASRARLRRGQAVIREIERRHPRHPPHWYLSVLGTDPAHQGTGVGSALVGHVVDDPANAGEAAYLETETEANVPFYRRFGFDVVDELDVPGGGPHLWLMWREPPGP